MNGTTYGVAIGDDLSVKDVDIDVAICDLYAIYELAEVGMGDASGGIGVRVLSDEIRVPLGIILWQDDLVGELTCNLYRVPPSWAERWRKLGGFDGELCVRVHWAKRE